MSDETYIDFFGPPHQLRRCSCFGGSDEEDPPEMTWRQAAKVAVTLWKASH
jgi:hypothetical protein